jgi:signal transduction histidine kinase
MGLYNTGTILAMDSLFSAVVLISVVLHAVLLIYVQARGGLVRTGRLWLSLTILLSMLASLLYFVPDDVLVADKLGRDFALTLTLAAMLTTFGALVVSDVKRSTSSRSVRVWLALGVVWLIALVVTAFLSEAVLVGQPDWLITAFNPPNLFSLTTIAGLSLLSMILLGIGFYAFYAAALPEVANRALYWVINIAVILLGIVLSISGTATLALLGLLTLLIGVSGALYAQVSYRVFDIRNGLNLAIRTALLVGVTALLVFAAMTVARTYNLGTDTESSLVLALIALGVALIYVPLRRMIEVVIDRIFRGRFTDPALATRRYSQQVSKAFELDQLIKVTTETLNDSLKVRRSGMMLVNDVGDDDRVELLVMIGGGFSDVKDKKGYMSRGGAVYQRLAEEKAPLTQFDMEFSPKYKNLSPSERAFFSSLNMSAFAPVIVENALIGILACGPKLNDAPFYPRDLELLTTLANQTGVALRNARLVADLRHMNNSMTKLNRGLEEAKDQMEKLDSVKTDFVTIASHELRTPLAQVRGYTDIIDALNEQGMLDQDQIKGMVANLRKATERMEELISAMLDVSQLDVNAMDLRFAQTSPESVIRLAIEPLTDAIKQRKLTLSARGLRGLPTIEADMQRLVQAFRNIVLNAIKFTPDGGRIEITASLQASEDGDGHDHVLIAIADTGVGIERQNLELIFEKFFRAYDPGLHSTGTYKFLGAGPGLGLTIARGVIEGHGGRIWAESPGHNMQTYPGTTFYVLLPVSPPEDARRVMPFESAGVSSGEQMVVEN